MEKEQISINHLENVNLQEIENEKKYNEVDKYTNNFDLKVSLINIDSKFRNITPKNIVDSSPIFLKNNPIELIDNSYEIKVNVENHNFNIGDQIILQNVINKTYFLESSFFLVIKFNYCIILLKDHNLNKITNKNNYDYMFNISNYRDLNNEDYRLIGNIPLNSILGIHKIYTLDNLNIKDSVLKNLISNINVNEESLRKDYLFFELPFEYSKENKLPKDKLFKDFQVIDLIFKCQVLNIGGIPFRYLNAEYPINYNQYQYSHLITNIEDNYIYFNSNVQANFSEISGGDKVYIGKILKSIEGYPNPNNYVIDLKNGFTDVVRIELISTEIPYIEYNINEKTNYNITNKTNKIYWKHLEDGNNIYSASISNGFYNSKDLSENLEEEMNKIPRISSTSNKIINNSFTIKINKNTHNIEFAAFKTESLPNSISIIKESFFTGSIKLRIRHPNNFVQVGDTITIVNCSNIGDVNASSINGDHTVFEVNLYSNNYIVLIPIEDLDEKFNLDGSGGTLINIKTPAKVSFLFNQPDTLGEFIGFNYVGEANAITAFSHKISNQTPYIYPLELDIVGNKLISNSIVNLFSQYYYYFMYINDFEGLLSNTNSFVDNPFSKILLAGNSGSILFNTFLNSPLEFDIPIASLNELHIKFVYPDGSVPDFRNFDHSFTLRITEKISRPVRTGIISRKQNYTNAIIEKEGLDEKLNKNRLN